MKKKYQVTVILSVTKTVEAESIFEAESCTAQLAVDKKWSEFDEEPIVVEAEGYLIAE